MAELFESGRIIDLIVVAVVLEAIALLLFRRWTGRGVAPFEAITNLSAGLSLMLAVRAALTDAGWTWVALFLAFALVAHLADLFARWR